MENDTANNANASETLDSLRRKLEIAERRLRELEKPGYVRVSRELLERCLAMVDGASPALMNDLEAMLKAGGEQ